MRTLSTLLIVLTITSGLAAQEPKAKKVLFIGIDGLRTDALRAADTPNFDELIAHGAMADDTDILPERYQKQETISGPGWSNLLTGVWADKHGVHENEFRDHKLGEFPPFFVRLKEQRPDERTASFVDWSQLELLRAGSDVHKVFPAEGAEGYTKADAELTEAASGLLRNEDVDAAFVYLGQVDETGHAHGFHPTVPEYMAAIERVDRHIGTLLLALRSRDTYAHEDWLILACTDHGGQGTGHGQGHNVPEIRIIWLLVSGPSATRGKIEQPTFQVDIAATALAHLGVQLDPAWKLDGQPVGLKAE